MNGNAGSILHVARFRPCGCGRPFCCVSQSSSDTVSPCCTYTEPCSSPPDTASMRATPIAATHIILYIHILPRLAVIAKTHQTGQHPLSCSNMHACTLKATFEGEFALSDLQISHVILWPRCPQAPVKGFHSSRRSCSSLLGHLLNSLRLGEVQILYFFAVLDLASVWQWMLCTVTLHAHSWGSCVTDANAKFCVCVYIKCTNIAWCNTK